MSAADRLRAYIENALSYVLIANGDEQSVTRVRVPGNGLPINSRIDYMLQQDSYSRRRRDL